MPADANAPLDLTHLARLANLPLTDDERPELEAACREVLEAFSLREAEQVDLIQGTCPTFEDEPRRWPPEGVEAIVANVPDKQGRHVRP